MAEEWSYFDGSYKGIPGWITEWCVASSEGVIARCETEEQAKEIVADHAAALKAEGYRTRLEDALAFLPVIAQELRADGLLAAAHDVREWLDRVDKALEED